MINGLIAQNWKARLARMPSEDSFSIDEKHRIIAVADGVTRDPSEILPNINTLSGKIKIALNYPRPSPATAAAQLFCRIFPAALRDYANKDEKAIKSAFEEANKAIKGWNERYLPCGTDYTLHDLAGCVAAGVSLDRDLARYGYISDCGIAVVDSNGNIRDKTEDLGPGKHEEQRKNSRKLMNKRWEVPKTREIVRSEFRNKPSEPLAYGVLTGEHDAMSYIQAGSYEVRPGDMLLVYSDGVADCLFKGGDISGEAADRIRVKDFVGLEDFCKSKVQSEGTLVYYI